MEPMKKTYQKDLYWFKAIEKLRSGEFTQEELDQWISKSGLWADCACGNADPRIPRDRFSDNEPKDDILRGLGLYFADLWYDGAMTLRTASWYRPYGEFKQGRLSKENYRLAMADALYLCILSIDQRSGEILRSLAKKKRK